MQNKKCCKNNTDLVCNNTDLECNNKVISEEPSDENKFYKFYPLILTFVFVIGGAAISQYNFENFKWNEFMKNLIYFFIFKVT